MFSLSPPLPPYQQGWNLIKVDYSWKSYNMHTLPKKKEMIKSQSQEGKQK